MTKGKAGRRAVDGVTNVNVRVNAMLTTEHKQRLQKLATEGVSAWLRAAIDKAWAKQQQKANS
jgi:hypothetical protein